MLDILAIAPHPDDAEIGVAGTLLTARARGLRVGVLDLTSGEPTPHGNEETRRAEKEAATQLLGLDWRGQLGLPNRKLQNDLESRRELAITLRAVRPRILLAPYWDDVHPDHVAASALVEAARFWAKLSRTDMPGEPFWPERIYYFWSIHLRIHPKPSFVIDVSEHIETKMQAIAAYESQFLTGRSREFPTVLDDIRDRARYWGWTISTAYAEPFACREEIGIPSLDVLL